jgi:hypothetical protein
VLITEANLQPVGQYDPVGPALPMLVLGNLLKKFKGHYFGRDYFCMTSILRMSRKFELHFNGFWKTDSFATPSCKT